MPERPDPALRDADALWAFSLAFYERPGIAETCLALQDRHGLDVNILLLCCWLGWSGQGRLGREDLMAMEAGVAAWRGAIVERLRSVRRALKGMPSPAAAVLRREIQHLELAAEREAQRLLLASRPPRPAVAGDDFTAAEHNLATYLATRVCPSDLTAPLLVGLREFR